MAKYNVYTGQFICQVCGAEVPTIRSYPSEKLLTWMCRDKHLSEVDLKTKKSKADYDRKG
jgi:hypothetical protein